MKKLLSALLVLCVLLSSLAVLASCSEDTPAVDGTTAGTDTSEEVTTADPSVYVYPEINLDNMDFKVLAFESIWSTNVRMDFPETTGIKLNDAIYERNRKVEGEFGLQDEGDQCRCRRILQASRHLPDGGGFRSGRG